MHESEKAYTTKEVSLTLDIGTSTLRKWCLALEENGYAFARADNNKRLFVERDLISLKYFKKLVQGENFSLENASKVITSKYSGEASETRTPAVLKENAENNRSSKRSEELILQLIERAEKQEQFNRELLERLDQQQKYIEQRLNAQEERLNERDDAVMQSLRESLETQKMLAATRAEEKKGFWSKLFGK